MDEAVTVAEIFFNDLDSDVNEHSAEDREREPVDTSSQRYHT